MKTLIINDLSRTRELDSTAMADVHGGMYKDKGPSMHYSPLWDGSKHDFSVSAEQFNSQTQVVENNNGVNAAFVDGIRSTIKPSQTASNSISF